MSSVDTAAVSASTPAAPAHLPAAVQKKWSAAYEQALKQAQINYAENPRAQRAAALRAANAMLSIPAPESAADIADLESWQVLVRGERTIDDVRVSYCVTADGRKYSFPVETKGKKAAS